ncbi:RDD family protein [Streptomyces sp. NPDC020875]|uniref:RDD family protein n=1 Tax=Streptomyces sp. NPDC020875 TaxID=3154898 RepID=UPI0033F235C4
MSAPTPHGGDGSPAPGYYPDPSIPGYVRYWNGASWVPGTSRPAPRDAGDAPAAEPAPPPAPTASAVPAVEETGPVFLDEVPEEEAAVRPEPASVWQADSARQGGFGGDGDRVAWGGPGAGGRVPAQPAAPVVAGSDGSQGPVPAEPVTDGTVTIRAVRPSERTVVAPSPLPVAEEPAPAPAAVPRQPEPRVVVPEQAHAAPAAPAPVTPWPQPQPQPQQPAPQQAPRPQPTPRPQVQPQPQVQAQPQAAVGGDGPVIPWKPPVEDPFLAVVRAQAAARPAGLGRRLVARLIDTVVLGAMVGAVAIPFVTAAIDHIDGKIEAAKLSGETVTVWLLDGTTGAQLGIVLAALLVLGVLYEVLPTAKWGRTLGKKLCGVSVVDIESHEPPAFGAALRRWLVYGGLGLIVLGVVNVLWCLVDRPWRQCWHDKAARTFVKG